MLGRTFVSTFIASMIAVGAWGQDAGSNGHIQRSHEAPAAGSNLASLRAILDVLDKAKLSGTLEFSGHCESLDDRMFPDVPQLRSPKTNGGTPLQTLREMFADNPAMRVTQDADGTIRMIERGTPTDILNVKIGHVSFDSSMGGTYNANSILNAILASENLNRFMKLHAIKWPYDYEAGSAIFAAGSTPPPVPHVETSLGNETISSALDRVLKAFPGLWLYESCPRKGARERMVYIRFYHLQGAVNGKILE